MNAVTLDKLKASRDGGFFILNVEAEGERLKKMFNI